MSHSFLVDPKSAIPAQSVRQAHGRIAESNGKGVHRPASARLLQILLLAFLLSRRVLHFCHERTAFPQRNEGMERSTETPSASHRVLGQPR